MNNIQLAKKKDHLYQEHSRNPKKVRDGMILNDDIFVTNI